MSVYVGIDVHRKRSQVAVVSEDGTVELNKNVVNGSEPMLRLIGDLPSGTPVAFEAAFGWGWLVQLLEDYGFEPHMVHPLRCKAIASARLKNDKGRCRDPGALRKRLCGRLELRGLWRRGVPDPPESPLPRARDCRSRVLRLVRDRRVETLPRADRAILAADPGRGDAGSGGAVLLRDATARDPAGFRTTPASRTTAAQPGAPSPSSSESLP